MLEASFTKRVFLAYKTDEMKTETVRNAYGVPLAQCGVHIS